MMKSRHLLSLLMLCYFTSLSSFAWAQNDGSDRLSQDEAIVSQGQGLFNGNCAQCHAIHEQIVGPKLAAVYERQSIDWLLNFIKYPEKVIQSGDEHAVEMYEKYKQIMPNHDFLSDDEILSILSYVQAKTIEGPPQAAVAAADGGAVGDTSAGGAVGGSVNTNLLVAIIAGLVILLIVVTVAMVLLVSVLSKYLKQQEDLTEEDKEYVSQSFDFGAIFKSPTFTGTIAFLFVAIVAKATVDGLFNVGVQQGYAPDQPIAFSHKLHAGYYEIDCKYCHTGVEKSKSANIPSANICMNCHNAIKTTSPEIQKIYTAIENDEPIQWVRVHNLPDLAYFNHAQHVKVGGLECESCHGEIQEMEVVQQHSLLTMGWCIACHRETKVNAKDNAYYDRLVALHNSNSKEPLVVENIGGLECAKCHY